MTETTTITRSIPDELHDASAKLREEKTHGELAEPLAHMLDGYRLRYDEEVIEDAPEGPCCAEPSTCGGHGEVEFHQECGGIIGADDPDEQCPCFHNAFTVARAINGTAS